MRSSRSPKLVSLSLLAFTLGVFLTSCGSGTGALPHQADQVATQCGPGVAKILVGNSYMRILCGCTGPGEADGTFVQSPNDVVCHLQPGANILFFNFSGSYVRHQIVSPTKQFAGTPVSDPGNGTPLYEFPIYLPVSGSYPFVDSFSSSQKGMLIVP